MKRSTFILCLFSLGLLGMKVCVVFAKIMFGMKTENFI